MSNIGLTQGKWAGRFIWAAVFQGLLATIITLLALDPIQYLTGTASYYSPARVIAGGSGGTWFFTGLISFIVVGVIATAVTAIFYFYIEGILGKPYKGLTNYLAWAHLILMNVGITGGTFLMMWGGYIAGWAAAPTAAGGAGFNPGQVHALILGWTPQPIGAFLLVAAIGALLGGLGYLLRSRAA